MYCLVILMIGLTEKAFDKIKDVFENNPDKLFSLNDIQEKSRQHWDSIAQAIERLKSTFYIEEIEKINGLKLYRKKSD